METICKYWCELERRLHYLNRSTGVTISSSFNKSQVLNENEVIGEMNVWRSQVTTGACNTGRLI